MSEIDALEKFWSEMEVIHKKEEKQVKRNIFLFVIVLIVIVVIIL